MRYRFIDEHRRKRFRGLEDCEEGVYGLVGARFDSKRMIGPSLEEIASPGPFLRSRMRLLPDSFLACHSATAERPSPPR